MQPVLLHTEERSAFGSGWSHRARDPRVPRRGTGANGERKAAEPSMPHPPPSDPSPTRACPAISGSKLKVSARQQHRRGHRRSHSEQRAVCDLRIYHDVESASQNCPGPRKSLPSAMGGSCQSLPRDHTFTPTGKRNCIFQITLHKQKHHQRRSTLPRNTDSETPGGESRR